MKSIGQLAKDFRVARGWSYTRMSQEVSRHAAGAVSRQAITQLEEVGTRKPHYLAALATVMGTTADLLLAGAAEPGDAAAPPAPAPALTECIAGLASALHDTPSAQRDQAAVLLQLLARDPSGPWAGWLLQLLTSVTVFSPQSSSEPVSGVAPVGYAQNKKIPSTLDKEIFNLGLYTLKQDYRAPDVRSYQFKRSQK
jgi:hypothetical protein